jgi:hypothetical protein
MDSQQITEPRHEIFLCSRTSVYDGCPCEDAFQILIPCIDCRAVDDPKKVPAYHGQESWWYEEGTNHRVENGLIYRDMPPIKVWAVKLSNIMDFVSKYGECIVSVSRQGYQEIEIYDSYRE